MSRQSSQSSPLTDKRLLVQTALREAAEAEQRNSERRVYVLPIELLDRVLDYQLAHLLPSEVSAVRLLLEQALDAEGFPAADPATTA